jgi:hypothetical protein
VTGQIRTRFEKKFEKIVKKSEKPVPVTEERVTDTA